MSLLDRLNLPPHMIENTKECEEVSMQQIECKQKEKEKYLSLWRKKKVKKAKSSYV